MKPQHLGPTHPCLGCPHKGPVFVIDRDGRKPAARICQHKSGQRDPLCWGDDLPTWCPEPRGQR